MGKEWLALLAALQAVHRYPGYVRSLPSCSAPFSGTGSSCGVAQSIWNDLVARIPALLLGCGFPNLLDIVDAV